MSLSNNTVSDYINQVRNDIQNCYIHMGADWYDEWFYVDRENNISLSESVIKRSILKDILNKATEEFEGLSFIMVPSGRTEIRFFCIVSYGGQVVEHAPVYTLALA